MVAVTPERPDNSLTTTEKNALTFPILTDTDNAFAKALGIAFDMPEALVEVYKKFGLDLPGNNATDEWALPIPATFVVATDGTIKLSHVDRNYTTRLEPADAVAALKGA